ncbi:unnamed protein product [Porites evermanni]|uniref:Endonuclease/exonuclease/phosphatase domain-containing protein n=1 Tax=Porites evermanni TaxID=104178 RepID=A0ABN8M4D9_9CNID|nr:unnamed protein product [Porites evermanni]
MFVILNWRRLLIIPRNDFVPSETLGTLTDWTGANYSTSICNLASRHLGLLPCRRCGISTLLFRHKGFSRPVMYYSNSNAIFQPELLIISGDVNVNPGPVSKRNQALGQLLQHVHRDTQLRKLLLKRIKGALYVGCVMIRRMSNVQVLRLILEFSLLPRLSRGPVIDVPSPHYYFSRKAHVMILTS